MAAQRARKFALLAGQTDLADETLEQIYDDVRQLVWAYPQRPLAEILGDLVAARTRYSPCWKLSGGRAARQLYLLGGILGGLLAKASHDTADPQAALTQSRTAYLCADQADHDGLRAWVRGLQSLITYWDGRRMSRCDTPSRARSSPSAAAAPRPSGCPSARPGRGPLSATSPQHSGRSTALRAHGRVCATASSMSSAASAGSAAPGSCTTRPTR